MPLVYNLINNNTAYEIGAGSCSTENVIIPDTYLGLPVKSIAPFAFQYCNLTGIEISNNVTGIGQRAFEYTANLAKVILPTGISSIEFGTFKDSSNLNYIELPDSVLTIKGAAFFGTSLSNGIKLSNNLITIEGNAFNSSDLRSINIPSSVNYIGYNSFSNCSNLIRINFLGNYPFFDIYNFNNSNPNFIIYRKKNFVSGWPNTIYGKPVALWSDNVIKSGGTGKLIGKSFGLPNRLYLTINNCPVLNGVFEGDRANYNFYYNGFWNNNQGMHYYFNDGTDACILYDANGFFNVGSWIIIDPYEQFLYSVNPSTDPNNVPRNGWGSAGFEALCLDSQVIIKK